MSEVLRLARVVVQLTERAEKAEAERDEAEARYTEVAHLGAELRAKLQVAERVVELVLRDKDEIDRQALWNRRHLYMRNDFVTISINGEGVAESLSDLLAAYDKEQAP